MVRLGQVSDSGMLTADGSPGKYGGNQKFEWHMALAPVESWPMGGLRGV